MKRAVVLVFVCSVPALLFLNAWQVFRFNEKLSDVRELEARQKELIEENKKVLVGIEVLSSPSRIDAVVGEMDGLEQRTEDPRIIIQIGAGGAR